MFPLTKFLHLIARHFFCNNNFWNYSLVQKFIKKINKQSFRMNSDGLELGSSQIQIKKQVAYIMSCFEDTIEGYSSNRRQLELVLNQLLKAHRSYKIHKSESKIISTLSNKQDIYFEYYLLNNIACCYNTKKELNKALQYLKLADKELIKLEELVQKSEFDYETRKIQLISIHMRMVKTKLNLCAIFTFAEKHVEALYECSQGFGVLQGVVDSVCDYSMGQKNHEDFLQLQKCIKQPYSEIKYVQIRNNYWNKVMNGQSDSQVRDIFLTIFKNSNSKQQVQVRSCLGKIITKNISKTDYISEESRKYLKQFSISSVMKVSPVNLQDFSKSKHKDDFISLRFLHELMVYLAIANYTVSTELRIGNLYDTEATMQSVSAQDQNSVFKKQNNLVQAERHHFFAIELMYKIASNYLKECPFFSRMIKIYEEIYLLKDNIEIIPEKVDEQNQVSMLPNQKKFIGQDQYFGKKFKQSVCQTPRVLKKILGPQGSQKDLMKLKKKQKQDLEAKRKKTAKKGSSISKNQYLCMSPRNNNTARLTSQQIRLKPKNKSRQKLPMTNTSNKSKVEFNPKSLRKNYRL